MDEVQACAREVGENLREVLQLAWVRPAGHRDGAQVGVETGGQQGVKLAAVEAGDAKEVLDKVVAELALVSQPREDAAPDPAR